jgi:predicted dehydrogenase
MQVAVVGTGSIGRRHLGNLLARGGCELLAVNEFSRREPLIVNDQTVAVCHEFDDALRKSDVVFICNPTGLHREYLEKSIAADCHVYLEKPIGLATEGFAPLLERASAKRLIVAVGTQFRFNRMLLQIRDWLASGRLGKCLNVFAYSGEHIADYHPGEDYRRSYAARRDLGGGVLLTQIHQIDYLNWLFGPFDRVSAHQVAVPELGVDVESSVTYQLFGDKNIPVSGHLNYLQRPKRTGMQIVATEGLVEWSYEHNSLVFTTAQGKAESLSAAFDRNQMFRDALDDFFDAIARGAKPRADLNDGLEAVSLVERIKQAMTATL